MVSLWLPCGEEPEGQPRGGDGAGPWVGCLGKHPKVQDGGVGEGVESDSPRSRMEVWGQGVESDSPRSWMEVWEREWRVTAHITSRPRALHGDPQLLRVRGPKVTRPFIPPGLPCLWPLLSTWPMGEPSAGQGLVVPRLAQGPSWVLLILGPWGEGGRPGRGPSLPTAHTTARRPSPAGVGKAPGTSPRSFPGRGGASLPRPHSLIHEAGAQRVQHTSQASGWNN